MVAEDDDDMVPVPLVGRVFEQRRTVGLGDADPSNRIRLDALARFLQDVATADYRDVVADGDAARRPADVAPDELGWVLRRLVVRVDSDRVPEYGDDVVLRTFAGGLGSRWAERRTQVLGPAGTRVECAGLWVAVDAAGRPARLTDAFRAAYGQAAAGRVVRARLWHEGVPPEARCRAWALRRCDLDTLGHVNNAAHWQAVEELLAGRTPVSAEIEFRDPLPGDVAPELRWLDLPSVASGPGGTIASWLCVGQTVYSSARVTFR